MAKVINTPAKELDKKAPSGDASGECTYADGPDFEGHKLVIGVEIGGEQSELLDWIGK